MERSGPPRGISWTLTLLLAGVAACATPARRGIDLSDAQREAAKDDTEKKKVLVAEEPRDEYEDAEDEPTSLKVGLALADALTTTETPTTTTEPSRTVAEDRHNISLISTGFSYSGSILKSQAGVGLQYGFYPEPKLRIDIAGYFLDGSLGSQGQGFTDFRELAAEAAGRFYLTADHTLLGLYMQVGARTGLFMWTYESPVFFEEDGNVVEIDDDMLTTYSAFVGLGVSPLQLSHFHLGVGANFGVRVYQGVTHEGFDNDVFPSVGYRQMYIEATAFF